MARSDWQPVRILGKGPWSLLPAQTWSVVTDFFLFAAGLALFYAVLVLARSWFAPFNPHIEISRSPSHLPLYAAYSLLRIAIAYILSLGFTLVYGYVAAYNPRAERIMIPAARHSAVDSRAQFSAGRHAGHGRSVSAAATRR